jgi:hypothetical protein
MNWQILAFVFGGTFFGAFLGPLLLEEYRAYRGNHRWRNPRKTLLEQKLKSASGQGWVSIENLARLIGTSEDECRTLLIEIKARGGTLKSGQEGWALISRRPLDGPSSENNE